MRCEKIQERLSAYLEGELERGERPALEDHLRECTGCHQELELLRQTVSVLQSLEEIEVPPRLTAVIQNGISAQERSRWRDLASWLFFPLHIKVPLEALALVLISFGAVYLFRSTPELAQAPQPSVATESVRRDRAAPLPEGRGVGDERGSSMREPSEPRAQLETAEEHGALRDNDAIARVLRKEAPAAAKAAPSLPILSLRTRDPSLEVSRIAEIAATFGGRLVEARDPDRVVLDIPASAFPQFLTALRDLGDLMPLPAEPPTAPSGEGTVTFSLRLIK